MFACQNMKLFLQTPWENRTNTARMLSAKIFASSRDATILLASWGGPSPAADRGVRSTSFCSMLKTGESGMIQIGHELLP